MKISKYNLKEKPNVPNPQCIQQMEARFFNKFLLFDRSCSNLTEIIVKCFPSKAHSTFVGHFCHLSHFQFVTSKSKKLQNQNGTNMLTLVN
jgi:hypothetical protein